jgi:hypothetical protein
MSIEKTKLHSAGGGIGSGDGDSDGSTGSMSQDMNPEMDLELQMRQQQLADLELLARNEGLLEFIDTEMIPDLINYPDFKHFSAWAGDAGIGKSSTIAQVMKYIENHPKLKAALEERGMKLEMRYVSLAQVVENLYHVQDPANPQDPTKTVIPEGTPWGEFTPTQLNYAGQSFYSIFYDEARTTPPEDTLVLYFFDTIGFMEKVTIEGDDKEGKKQQIELQIDMGRKAYETLARHRFSYMVGLVTDVNLWKQSLQQRLDLQQGKVEDVQKYYADQGIDLDDNFSVQDEIQSQGDPRPMQLVFLGLTQQIFSYSVLEKLGDRPNSLEMLLNNPTLREKLQSKYYNNLLTKQWGAQRVFVGKNEKIDNGDVRVHRYRAYLESKKFPLNVTLFPIV